MQQTKRVQDSTDAKTETAEQKKHNKDMKELEKEGRHNERETKQVEREAKAQEKEVKALDLATHGPPRVVRRSKAAVSECKRVQLLHNFRYFSIVRLSVEMRFFWVVF
jgi:hypothetical protein